jgi:hypothetical protein
MKTLVLGIGLALLLIPAAARAQLSEMRQTIFGMD